jgi:prolyl-tRNA synthetase
VVDEVAANSPNLVFGANQDGRHVLNVNFGRDYEAGLVADISRVKKGDNCTACGREFEEIKSLELGNIFKLGDFYTRASTTPYPTAPTHFP